MFKQNYTFFQDLLLECGECNAFNDSLAHPPRYIYDQPVQDSPTWWQSISWYNYNTPLEINITLSLNHSYTINSEIKIVFVSSLPRRMVLEKSSDYGQTWQPYQYYAHNCSYFKMNATDERNIRSPTEVICSQQYSSGPQTMLYLWRGGHVQRAESAGAADNLALPRGHQAGIREQHGAAGFPGSDRLEGAASLPSHQWSGMDRPAVQSDNILLRNIQHRHFLHVSDDLQRKTLIFV